MIPKTNLFQGDRVRLSQTYINGQKFLVTKSAGHGHGGAAIFTKSVERVGTIVNDTLDPKQHAIKVCWDGNSEAHRKDEYMPCDLDLVEEGPLVKKEKVA